MLGLGVMVTVMVRSKLRVRIGGWFGVRVTVWVRVRGRVREGVGWGSMNWGTVRVAATGGLDWG